MSVQVEAMSGATINRRVFLRYVGAGVSAVVGSSLLGPLARLPGSVAGASIVGAIGAFTRDDGTPFWTPVAYPVPQPGDGGDAASDATRFASFDVQDDVVLPQGYRYDVLAEWGDRFGPPDEPTRQISFGFNADYTGLVPVQGKPDEFFLIVNHEYISARPWVQGVREATGEKLLDDEGRLAGMKLAGVSLNLLDPDVTKNMNPRLLEGAKRICQLGMADLGVSVLHVRRDATGRFQVIKNSRDHLRISGASGREATNDIQMSFTGPAADLLGKCVGTYSNCSGETTPWGTFLSCEENFQDQASEFITPGGKPLPGDRKDFAGFGEGHPTNLPFEFEGLGTGLTPPLDGRQYGWVCEIDPVRRTMKKHTALGRFRHENVAIRAEAGKKLVAYMGDDRRGGHVWKFVSDEVVNDPKNPENSKLLEKGTLYVARFDENFTGRWVALAPETPVLRPQPQHTTLGRLWLPARPNGGHVQVAVETDASTQTLGVQDWVLACFDKGVSPVSERYFDSMLDGGAGPAYAPAHLKELVSGDLASGVLMTDAYVFANCVGGTPTARPEDIEIHPIDQSVYVAFTDSTGSGDGSPDARIFPDSRGENSRQYGAIYRLVERDNDPAATKFAWGKFVTSGEAADGGGGFACADNLTFDPQANLWMVCDITTPRHNFPVNREDKATTPGGSGFVGVFGNNAMFMIPTRGEKAGVPLCFATGPMESELTGPTFTPDGRTLLISVQHPGELHGRRATQDGAQRRTETRDMKIAARDGTIFTQSRTVPLGSNFPGKTPGAIPKPAVLCITRQP